MNPAAPATVHETQSRRWSTFYPAQKPHSPGALLPIFAPRSYLHLLHQGGGCSYLDRRTEIQSSDESRATSQRTNPVRIFDYAVSSVNGNGEGPISSAADTDPASWRNWDQKPREPFRRVYSYPQDSPELLGMQSRFYPT